jgi:hypothetical protein
MRLSTLLRSVTRPASRSAADSTHTRPQPGQTGSHRPVRSARPSQTQFPRRRATGRNASPARHDAISSPPSTKSTPAPCTCPRTRLASQGGVIRGRVSRLQHEAARCVRPCPLCPPGGAEPALVPPPNHSPILEVCFVR